MCIFIPYLITQAISNTFQVSCETNKTPAFFDASLNFQLAKEGEKNACICFISTVGAQPLRNFTFQMLLFAIFV